MQRYMPTFLTHSEEAFTERFQSIVEAQIQSENQIIEDFKAEKSKKVGRQSEFQMAMNKYVKKSGPVFETDLTTQIFDQFIDIQLEKISPCLEETVDRTVTRVGMQSPQTLSRHIVPLVLCLLRRVLLKSLQHCSSVLPVKGCG